jgi:hypothetical protein
MLRPYFLFHRELLGELARLAYETVRERMAAASDQPMARPGIVAVIQTFGSSLNWNPHIHAIVTRGVFLDDGSWQPVAYVDSYKAELVFRHKVLGLLRDRELITPEGKSASTCSCRGGIPVLAFTTEPPSIPPTPRVSTSWPAISCGPR